MRVVWCDMAPTRRFRWPVGVNGRTDRRALGQARTGVVQVGVHGHGQLTGAGTDGRGASRRASDGRVPRTPDVLECRRAGEQRAYFEGARWRKMTARAAPRSRHVTGPIQAGRRN